MERITNLLLSVEFTRLKWGDFSDNYVERQEKCIWQPTHSGNMVKEETRRLKKALFVPANAFLRLPLGGLVLFGPEYKRVQ